LFFPISLSFFSTFLCWLVTKGEFFSKSRRDDIMNSAAQPLDANILFYSSHASGGIINQVLSCRPFRALERVGVPYPAVALRYTAGYS
jgi:hypothetical protein